MRIVASNRAKAKLHDGAAYVNTQILEGNNLVNTENGCPRCGEERLKAWADLNEDERQIVPRLPTAVEEPLAERQRTHLWCTRCWYEARDQGALA